MDRPAGRLPTIIKQSADPAAGAEVTYVADEDMIVHSAYVVLVTSAAVANRRVHLIADDGANGANNIFFREAANVDVTATLTEPVSAYEGAQANSSGGKLSIPLPLTGIRLRKGDRLRTLTTGIDVADNYGPMNIQAERW